MYSQYVLVETVPATVDTLLYQNDHVQELDEQNVVGNAQSLSSFNTMLNVRCKQARNIFRKRVHDHRLDEYAETLLDMSLKLNKNQHTDAALLRARAVLDTIPRRQEALIKTL